MVGQIGPMHISDVRQVVAELIREQPVSQPALEAARDTVRRMCDQAGEHGMTKAEVVKAVLRPVFAKKSRCDCPACIARRAAMWDETGYREGSALSAPHVNDW